MPSISPLFVVRPIPVYNENFIDRVDRDTQGLKIPKTITLDEFVKRSVDRIRFSPIKDRLSGKKDSFCNKIYEVFTACLKGY